MPAHWVIFTFFAWGHLRPETNLAVTLARKFPEVVVSLLVDADFSAKAQDEINRNASLGSDTNTDLLSRIRVMALGRIMENVTPEMSALMMQMDPRHLPSTPPAVVQRVQAAFDEMMLDQPVTDDHLVTWQPVGAVPSLMICDLTMGYVCPPLKAKYGVPLYMWSVGCATSLTRSYGPPARGGRGAEYVEECLAVDADERRRNGRSFGEIAKDVWARSSNVKDDIIKIKGLPPFYQWEDVPQSLWFPTIYDVIVAGRPLLQVTDGILLPTLPALEPDGVQDLADWYTAETGGKILCLGPQLPPEYFMPSSEGKSTLLSGQEVQYASAPTGIALEKTVDPSIQFLQEALGNVGTRCAIYISFGSLFFPQALHLQILLEALLGLDKPMPFIITTASLNTILSDELKKKIEQSGRGLIVPWAPQQAILAHPALGWIVSHCGGGGTFESLSAGIPMIAWPFLGDQPQQALWMSEVLDTAFELLQVRAGPVKGKAYRGGHNGTEIIGTEEAIKKELVEVLLMCQGEEGKRKRKNAEAVAQRILDARRPGGQIDQHLECLLAYIA